MKALRADERDMLAAYTAGANAGLAALGAPPFEYLALRSEPAKWRDEDSLLCALAMYRDLQGRQPWQESLLGLMRETLPPALAAFLAPVGTEWDAPIEGDPIPMPAVPGPEIVDLRRAQPEEPVARAVPPPDLGALAFLGVPLGLGPAGDDDMVRGSNNWAVAGTHTVHGGALLANDMHLGISVPNTWYRVSLVFPGVDGERRVTGVTLPGAPFVVAGSNGHVAWGFTNSEGDWADLVLLEPDPGNPEAYLTPEGPRMLERETETIEVKGEKAETLAVESTIWGPVIDKDYAGRRRALAWVALREGGLNASLVRMESVGGLDEAQALAPEAGMPEPEPRRGRLGGAHRLDDHRPHPAPRGPRRERAHLVGGREAALGRLARARGLPSRRGPAERPHLDGQRARRRPERSSPGWAWAATTSAPASARSATTFSPSTRRARATCCACSSTTVRSSSRAGRSSFSRP